MRIHVEFILFHGFEPEISWVKGESPPQTGGTPPEPIWRHLVTWRRVLRTKSADLTLVSARCLEHFQVSADLTLVRVRCLEQSLKEEVEDLLPPRTSRASSKHITFPRVSADLTLVSARCLELL